MFWMDVGVSTIFRRGLRALTVHSAPRPTAMFGIEDAIFVL
jgi:hypothetical protein